MDEKYVILYHGILLINENKWIIDTWKSTDESQKFYAGLKNKSNRKRVGWLNVYNTPQQAKLTYRFIQEMQVCFIIQSQSV